MSIAELDNPVWESLSGRHQHLAIGGDLAKRHFPDVIHLAAVVEDTEQAFTQLASIVDVGETILIAEMSGVQNNHWEILQQVMTSQMIYSKLIAAPQHDVNIQALTAKDISDMMALIELTKPGPFKERTIEMGIFIGIYQDNQLIAMAGNRICTPNYREISGVCTHPDYRGKGYGSLLTKLLVHQFQQDGITPFLHVFTTNENAIRLYQKLGFETHQEKAYTLIRKLDDK